MSAKRKLAMSGVAILVVLTLVAGATMAWFTDTEKVNANFKAGILDISVSDDDASDGTELNFVNMRPMEEDHGNCRDDGYPEWRPHRVDL